MSNTSIHRDSVVSGQDTNPFSGIPKLTSQWTSGVLKSLKIFVITERLYPLMNVHTEATGPVNTPLEEWLKDVMLKTRYITTYNALKMKVKRTLDHLKTYKPLHRLDFENIEEIIGHEAFLFQENLDTNSSDITSALPVLKFSDHWEKNWYHMFHCSAGNFAADLKYMMTIFHEDRKIPKSMYSTLFLDFIGMFGVRGVAEPSFPDQKLSIGDEEVTSSPDIVLLDRFNVKKDTPGAYKTDILSVIKVKTESRGPCIPPPTKLQRRELPSKLETEIIVDDNLLHQHLGDLVVNRQLSSSDQGVMGMIVQDTHIVFTYLSCSKEQFEKIKCGTFDYIDNQPSVMFSKSYNYLKASDREHLIETLLILGLLQECG